MAQEVRAGFTYGQITVAPLPRDDLEDPVNEAVLNPLATNTMFIPFQNENLHAFVVSKEGTRKVCGNHSFNEAMLM